MNKLYSELLCWAAIAAMAGGSWLAWGVHGLGVALFCIGVLVIFGIGLAGNKK